MSLAELQKYTAISKYARWIPEKKRRETYEESVERVEGMMLGRFPQLSTEIKDAYAASRRMEVLGSQRTLQFGGEPQLRHHARGYNCTSSYCDRLRFFGEAFYLLLCGCGAGFSVQERHIKHLPEYSLKRRRGVKLSRKKFVIPDSIEGWADALLVLLSSYHSIPVKGFEKYHDCEVEFIFSKIRPKGAPLSFGIGKAPGPEPLKKALDKIRTLLDWYCRQADRMSSIVAYDILMHAADAVISGGVRRSATICLFDRWDEEMMQAKTGNWYNENPQRGRSNNSAVLPRGEVAFEEFRGIFTKTRQFGEPGFYFVDSPDIIPNPCFRGNTRISTSRGLQKIQDLFLSGGNNSVVVDRRAKKGNEIQSGFGVDLKLATHVELTQRGAKIYRLTTGHGYYVEATANHTFPTPNGRKRLDEMIAGDTLFLQSGEGRFGDAGDYDSGFILGLITGDGTQTANSFYVDLWEDDFYALEEVGQTVNRLIGGRRIGWQNQNTGASVVEKQRIGGIRLRRHFENLLEEDVHTFKDRVPEAVFCGSREFVVGYLRGLLFTDGFALSGGEGKKKTVSYRFGQSNKELIEDVQMLLLNLGIVSKFYERREEGWYELPDGCGGMKEYFCKTHYELIINRPNSIRLLEEVGLVGRKADLLEEYLDERGRDCRKPERFIARVKDIEYVATEDVYCLHQPETNTVIANGIVASQCVEISFHCYLPDPLTSSADLADYDGPVVKINGEDHYSGWQMCNLSTINAKTCSSADDFYYRCRHASLIGTLQASFTSFPYLGRISEKIVEREALLGVSIAGIMHKPDLFLNHLTLQRGAEEVMAANEAYAKLIGINPAARGTCIKPDGNSASLIGTFSGCHPGKFRRGFRIVQANQDEAPYQYFRSMNPEACEPSAWSTNGTDDCIRFCVEYEGKLETEMRAVEFLDAVRLLQKYWVESGKREDRCTHPSLCHNVSNTVRVRDDEWDAVAEHIYKHRDTYAGISLLSWHGDRDYRQAPFTTVYTPEELEKFYGRPVLDHAEKNSLFSSAEKFFKDPWEAADVALGYGEPAGPRQKVWLKAFNGFVEKFFFGNTLHATYLMKDLFNLRKYEELKAAYREVDYSKMVEEENNTDLQGEVACAGGACEVGFLPTSSDAGRAS